MDDRKIALFDFDGTLRAGDSFIDFALFSVGPVRFGFAILQALPALAAWKFGRGSNSKAKEMLFSKLYRGRSARWLAEKGRQFAGHATSKERAEIVEKLRSHLCRGHKVYIVTASIPAWIEPWASKLGQVRVLGTRPETDTYGRLTGRFLGANCYGPEKIRRVREDFPDFDKVESWGYGDSSGDDPMLAAVTHPERVGK